MNTWKSRAQKNCDGKTCGVEGIGLPSEDGWQPAGYECPSVDQGESSQAWSTGVWFACAHETAQTRREETKGGQGTEIATGPWPKGEEERRHRQRLQGNRADGHELDDGNAYHTDPRIAIGS